MQGRSVSTVDPMSGDTTSSASPVFAGNGLQRAGAAHRPTSSRCSTALMPDQTWHRAQIVLRAGSPAVTWRAAPSGSLSEATHTIEVAAMDQALAVSSSSDQGAGGDCAALGGGTAYEFAVEAVPESGTLVDAGFESRVRRHRARLRRLDAVRCPRQGRVRQMSGEERLAHSAWVQGTAATAYTGVIESESGAMSSLMVPIIRLPASELRQHHKPSAPSTTSIPRINNAARALPVRLPEHRGARVSTRRNRAAPTATPPTPTLRSAPTRPVGRSTAS